KRDSYKVPRHRIGDTLFGRNRPRKPKKRTRFRGTMSGDLNLGHSALTDHRILRIPSQSPLMADAARESPDDLIYHTKPSPKPDAAPDLRTLALAYFEVSQLYPAFRRKGFALLEQAARELPDDAEVQAAYGMV